MKQRESTISRNTKETQIELDLKIDGTGKFAIKTPVKFLNHMLELFAFHGLFDLSILAKGDDYADVHHVVEDVGIALGEAFLKALGDKKRINRYGFFILPMDEVLATAAIDVSGRYAFRFDGDFRRETVGDLPTELVYDFWDAFAQNAKINLHIKLENGRNDHHKIEAIFKSVARALRDACAANQRFLGTLSTKGVL
jgi:imidazoleglycerol-phosphate dehydratase